MAQEKKEDSWFSQDLLSRLLNYSAFIIIFVVTISFIIITSVRSCSSSKDPHAGTSIKQIKFINVPKIEKGKEILMSEAMFKELKVTTDSLNNNIQKFNDIKTQIVEIEERNKDDMKFYLTILGSIIAVVGFFGFKSINDTRESSIKFATDEAKLTAKGIATAEAKDAIKEEHQDWTTKITTIEKNYEDLKTLLAPIGDLETKITNLKIRIDTLENKEMEHESDDEKTPNTDSDEPDLETPIQQNTDSDNDNGDLDSEDKFADKKV